MASQEREVKAERAKEIYEEAETLIFGPYSDVEHHGVGLGAGRGIIGYRMETKAFSVTLPVKLKISPENTVKIRLEEVGKGGPNYSFNKDGIVIVDIAEEERVLYHLRHSSIEKRGNEANSQEMEEVAVLLYVIKEGLWEQYGVREKKPQERWPRNTEFRGLLAESDKGRKIGREDLGVTYKEGND